MLHYIYELLVGLLNKPTPMYSELLDQLVRADIKSVNETTDTIEITLTHTNVFVCKIDYSMRIGSSKSKVQLTEHMSSTELFDLVDIVRYKGVQSNNATLAQ